MYQEISLETTQEYVLGIVNSSKTGFTIYYNSNSKIDLAQPKPQKPFIHIWNKGKLFRKILLYLRYQTIFWLVLKLKK